MSGGVGLGESPLDDLIAKLPWLFKTMVSAGHDVATFSQLIGRLRLRSYQAAAARAIVDSVIGQKGLTFVVIFPRQSGKNETQAMIESYLLLFSARANGEMVKVSPTWKPQSQNAMHRLERRLRNSLLVWWNWRKEQGYMYVMGSARMTFLSASPTANIVGATATLLLECDEAQDVLPEKWDKEISPMAASSNATRVFWGTAWTSSTLLAREMRQALAAQDADGIQRLFRVTADEVGQEVPAYLRFVRGEIARQGRNHPHVKTQYFCEEIETAGGMFPPERLALMHGDHDPYSTPHLGAGYAFLLDLAGEDETMEGVDWQISGGLGAGEHGMRRDATALTVVEVDPASAADVLLRLPTYRVVQRRAWTGIRQPRLYGLLRALGELWRPRCWVVDATGVGAGMASFLERAFPGKIIAFAFSAASKSKLGWDFLAVVETGRFKDYRAPEAPGTDLDLLNEFNRELRYCEMEVIPGPEHHMRWGVPDGSHDLESGAWLHDDLVISAAFCAELDALEWNASGTTLLVRGKDPLGDLSRGY